MGLLHWNVLLVSGLLLIVPAQVVSYSDIDRTFTVNYSDIDRTFTVNYSDIDRTFTVNVTEADCEPYDKSEVTLELFVGEVNPANNLTIVNITVAEIDSSVSFDFYLLAWLRTKEGRDAGWGVKSGQSLVVGKQYDFAFEWHPECFGYRSGEECHDRPPHRLELNIVTQETNDNTVTPFEGSVSLEVHVALSGNEYPAEKQYSKENTGSTIGFEGVLAFLTLALLVGFFKRYKH
ncbi:MAG: hypothetical protein ACXAB4_10540 [Candidatus Hodarchaeales archaeon]|jgi:hypothetical protein